jgi:hypothetical protein
MSNTNRWSIWGRAFQFVGVCLFVVSFFLPACHETANGPGTSNRNYTGYECAVYLPWLIAALIDVLKHIDVFKHIFSSAPARGDGALALALIGPPAIGGLLNPTILAYLLAARRHGGKMAVLVIACIILALAVVLAYRFTPLIGFYLWVLGALLILTPELTKRLPIAREAE